MTSIVKGYFQRCSDPRHKTAGWFVEDRWYANSAAKFWCGLLTEFVAVYPEATSLELESCVSGPLSSSQLDPLTSLQRMLDECPDHDFEEELRRTAAELELLGPPGSVTYRIKTNDGSLLEKAILPNIDAELLPHLAVWLPEWAGIDSSEWNDREIEARLSVRSPEQGSKQSVIFRLHNSVLHEGLYRCLIRLQVAGVAEG